MPSVVTKKIGSAGTGGMDYTTLQAWEDDLDALPVVNDVQQIGECYDQGKFTAGLTISDQTTDATRNIILRCAAGESFSTKAGVRSTPLLYNDAGGVAVEMSAGANITVSTQHTLIEGLQLKQTGYSPCINAAVANVTIKDCILSRGGGNAFDGSTSVRWINTVFQHTATAGNSLQSLGKSYNCTFVNTAGAGTSKAIDSQYGVAHAENCLFLGYSDNIVSTLDATSDYNATDRSSIDVAGGGGTHDVLNLTAADQLESVTADFRVKSGHGLQHGTPDATNAPLDISQTARDGTNPTIGAWEYVAVAAGSAAPRSLVHTQSVNRSSNY